MEKHLPEAGCRLMDLNTYYRRDVYRHFTEDCKCSSSITARVDVTRLWEVSERGGTKFYINFLYLLSKVLNSREEYRMVYRWESDELLVYDQVNPIQYIFHEDTETCTPVYTMYDADYSTFYAACAADIAKAKERRGYELDPAGHPNWFDASYISWLDYDALHLELPDGYLHLMPIVHWGRFRQENGRRMMPLTVRLNHAAADGYLVAKVFLLLQKEIESFQRL